MNLQKKGDKLFTFDKFKLSNISYSENREIVGMTIVNQNCEIVYSLGQHTGAIRSEKVSAINKELERTGVALDAVLGRYGVASIDDMSDSIYQSAINSLRKTKSVPA